MYMYMHPWFTLSRAQLNHIHLLLLGKVSHHHINRITFNNVAGFYMGHTSSFTLILLSKMEKDGKEPKVQGHAYTCTLYM